jgi:imidazolonepropionase
MNFTHKDTGIMLRNYLLTNIKELIQVRDESEKVLLGEKLKSLPSIKDAFLYVKDDLIADFGEMKNFDLSTFSEKNPVDEKIDCTGKIVTPAFCDSHTHLVFAAWREQEFADRIRGLSYEEIAARGGGILNSAKKLNETQEMILLANTCERLKEIKNYGTCAVEIKSGYGLSLEGELKMLDIIKQLKEVSDLKIKSTFLGAHSFPEEYKNDHRGYIKLLIEKIMPRIAEENLADYCDVFCERNYFSEEETVEILEAALKYGMKPRVHANQLSRGGGVQAGVKVNAVSVDHLEFLGDEEIGLLKNSNTMATLLPGAAFFLNLPSPPARKMIDAGVKIALATDYNPGTSPNGNMSMMLSLACVQLKMTTEEAFNAATLNGARAMEIENEFGSITIGKKARLLISKNISSLDEIPYRFGWNWIDRILF